MLPFILIWPWALSFLIVLLLQKNKGTILLTGQTESGKDTLLHILKGEGFSQSYSATPSKEEQEVSSDNLSYILINISGNKQFNKQKEKIKNELEKLKTKESQRKIIYVYIFDILKFKEDNTLISAEINNALKEAESRNFKAKIIATRGDKIDQGEKEILTNQIRQGGADFAIFDMTTLDKKQAFDFLEKGV